MQSNKEIYTELDDAILNKRYRSDNALRKYVHRAQYDSVIRQIRPGELVLDAGCGDGVLACLLAKQKGVRVVGVDLSTPNIERARKLANEMHVEQLVHFEVGDAEQLPFDDASFDVVVSSHVLEHLPEFDQGVKELYRVTKGRAVVALPTIFNWCSMVQVGHGSFWEISKRSLLAFPVGIVRTIFHLFGEGVNEGYGGRKDLIHIFRFPWAASARLLKVGFHIDHVEASTLAIPFFSFCIPMIERFDRMRTAPIFRWCGYGTTFVLRK